MASSSSTTDLNEIFITQLSLKNLILNATEDHLIITHFEEYHRVGGDMTSEILENYFNTTNTEKKKQKGEAEREGRRTINDNRYTTTNELSNNSHTVFITGNNATTGPISTADAPGPQPIPTPVPANTSRVWDIGSISVAAVGAETVQACWQHATPEQLAKANVMEGVAGAATAGAAILAKKMWFW